MVNPLKKLQLAQRKLYNLSEIGAKKEVLTATEIKFAKGKGKLKKLESVTGTSDFETFSIVGDTIPKRWCPEVVPKASSKSEIEKIVNNVLDETQSGDVNQIVQNIFSDPSDPNLIVINGGTP